MFQKSVIKPKVAFKTLGCKLNFSETSEIAKQFKEKDYSKVSFVEKADVYIINTCSVTENADKKFKALVRKCSANNPKAFIGVIGCYAQLNPKEVASELGVDLVLGASEKFKLIDYLGDLSKKEVAEYHSCEIEDVGQFESSFSANDRTRAFLKVQDGCNYKCTYCTIPLARGTSRSGSIESIIENAKEIAEQGVKEIVLTGVNIGDFGVDSQEKFIDLLIALDVIEGVERYRISSIEPNLLSDSIIEFLSKSRKFVPHFHIPLQSGSDNILKKMKRRYLSELYRNKVNKIKSLLPEACIGVDVIVGFPGETDALYMDTVDFIESLNISYLHVFPYSERVNTESILFEDKVRQEIKTKRSQYLRNLSIKKLNAFYESQLGKSKWVLFECENKMGYIHGYTDNYLKVREVWNPELKNSLRLMKIIKIDEKAFARGRFL